jgi:hypothetical protein
MLAIRSLAGETTVAYIDLAGDFMATLGLGDALWWITWVLGWVWALFERNFSKSRSGS